MGKKGHRISFLILSLASLLSLAFQSHQTPAINFIDFRLNYVFGQDITFTGTLQSSTPIQDGILTIKPTNSDSQIVKFDVAENGAVKILYDLAERPLQAFTQIEYWYQVTSRNGEKATSPVYSFFYEDNGFTWQRLDTDSVKIAWIPGDLDFGNALQNTTSDSIQAARSILPADFPVPIRIYVYPTAQEMQAAAQLTDIPWAAGHTNPDLGVILISIPPGPDSRAEMERQIPHELMHILEYQVAGTAYNQLPVWLQEGLASNAELYPNPEYQRVLQKAVEEDALLPLSVLCTAFPRDLSGALLAYAQSGSFVRFLMQNYGSSTLVNLMQRYSDGMSCEAGIQSALGVNLTQVEARWQEEMLGRNPGLAAWKQIWPYLLLAAILFIPMSLSIILTARKPASTGESPR
jgi:hypothetical protein